MKDTLCFVSLQHNFTSLSRIIFQNFAEENESIEDFSRNLWDIYTFLVIFRAFRGTFSNEIHRVDSIRELVVTPVIHENEIPKEEIG